MDKQSCLRLQGLYEYYSKNGRLKVDNDRIGIGSLNDIISGQFLINAEYDSSALSSIIQLIGQNNIYLSSFIKYIIFLSNVQEYKVFSEVDQFSDIFIFLLQEWGKLLHTDILNNPGSTSIITFIFSIIHFAFIFYPLMWICIHLNSSCIYAFIYNV